MIEDIILENDQRGISQLRDSLPLNFCDVAAQALYKAQSVLLVTGFYILSAEKPETDGPPATVSLGESLLNVGKKVTYATDKYTVNIIKGLINGQEVVEFPIMNNEESDRFAKNIIDQYMPDVIVSIERCGMSKDGIYRNMRSKDISAYTAKMDLLFSNHSNTVGVGDGGNEIGMGKFHEKIKIAKQLPDYPTITPTKHLVISSVSNWGAWGIIAALSLLFGKNLLPDIETETQRIKQSVDLGAVDGFSGKAEYKVDSFDIEKNMEILTKLHKEVIKHE